MENCRRSCSSHQISPSRGTAQTGLWGFIISINLSVVYFSKQSTIFISRERYWLYFKASWEENLSVLRVSQVSWKPDQTSSWCYETFFGGNLENRDFPLSRNSKNWSFESNKQFLSIVLLENSIVFTFLCRFWHKTNVFQFLNFGEIELSSKKSFIKSTLGKKC